MVESSLGTAKNLWVGLVGNLNRDDDVTAQNGSAETRESPPNLPCSGRSASTSMLS